MKLADLQRSKSFVLLVSLLVGNITFATQPVAHAVSTGSAPCSVEVTSSDSVSVVSSGGSCYLILRGGSINWTVPTQVTTASILVIGGGGAGGSGAWGGGGGAGGVVYDSSYSLTPGNSYSMAVGAGGAPGSGVLDAPANISNNGGDSWFFSNSTLKALGGGAGASYAYGNTTTSYCLGRDGGSGGGGTECANGSVNSGGAALQQLPTGADAAYGNRGGSTRSANDVAGGGGGGAGAAGGDVTAAGAPGRGGDGTNAFASWLTAITPGMTSISGWATATSSGYIAGGGGGASNSNQLGGGSGGGGTGGVNTDDTTKNGSAGVTNTGSGGGGSSYLAPGGVGGAGGSGLIIIKYQTPDVTAPTITGPSSATGSTSAISIQESTTAVHSFTANETVTWSKSGTDQSFFTLSAGGVLTISARNFESPADSGGDNTYIVAITATDTALNATTQTLTVTITNLNEAPTIAGPSAAATYAITQAENSASVATYSASDVDAGTSFNYSISGTDAGDFAINAANGVLTFAASPDFEGPTDSDRNNIYIVIITVSDGALTDTQELTVTITNLNESTSINAPTISGTIYKGVVTTISVTLNAPGKLRFFVDGKRISTCLARATSGSYPNYLATCSWKPSGIGKQSLTAQFSPSDSSFTAATTPSTTLRVFKRGNYR